MIIPTSVVIFQRRFDEKIQDQLQENIASMLGVPAERVWISVIAGSVVIKVIILPETEEQAGAREAQSSQTDADKANDLLCSFYNGSLRENLQAVVPEGLPITALSAFDPLQHKRNPQYWSEWSAPKINWSEKRQIK